MRRDRLCRAEAGANGVSDLSRAIAYMESHGGPDVTLAQGTEPFSGPLLP